MLERRPEREAQRRQHAEKHRGNHERRRRVALQQDGDGQHPCKRREYPVDAVTTECHPERSACQRQQKPLDQQLTDNARTATADSEPNRELLAASSSAREQHGRQVEADREEHGRRHAEQDDAERGEDTLVSRRRARAETRHFRERQRLMLVFGGKRAREALAEERKRLRCSRHRDVVSHACDEEEGVGIGVRQRACRLTLKIVRQAVEHAEREEQLGSEHRHRAGETLWRDPDDREPPLVDANRLAEEGRVESRPLPIRVGRHDHRHVLARPAFLGGESASLQKRDRQHVEVVCADDHGQRASRFRALADTHNRRVERDDAGKHLRVFRDFLIGRVCKRAVVAGAAVARVNLDQLLRLRERPRRERESMNDAEHRRVQPDTEREHAGGGKREARRLQELAERGTQVVHLRMGRGRRAGLFRNLRT